MSISEEQLKEAMNQYADLRHHIELLESNFKTVIEQIITKHPEIQNEIDSVKEELEPQIEKAKETEKKQKKVLQSMIEQFSKNLAIKDKYELKSSMLRVGLEREISYDATGLDGYMLSHPEIGMFRSEKITSRITLNKL